MKLGSNFPVLTLRTSGTMPTFPLFVFTMKTETKLLYFLVIEKYDSEKNVSSPISEGHIFRHFGNIIL